ncbi:MAG: hypothetical protein R3321_11425 [Nitrososphaeraceae archaeon]|nr:hypothetical protein [Nitrososphaeraceae archaeon]
MNNYTMVREFHTTPCIDCGKPVAYLKKNYLGTKRCDTCRLLEQNKRQRERRKHKYKPRVE